MALYAFDGTGQRDDNPDAEDVKDTNVARFLFLYRPNDADLPIDDRKNQLWICFSKIIVGYWQGVRWRRVC